MKLQSHTSLVVNGYEEMSTIYSCISGYIEEGNIFRAHVIPDFQDLISYAKLTLVLSKGKETMIEWLSE